MVWNQGKWEYFNDKIKRFFSLEHHTMNLWLWYQSVEMSISFEIFDSTIIIIIVVWSCLMLMNMLFIRFVVRIYLCIVVSNKIVNNHERASQWSMESDNFSCKTTEKRRKENEEFRAKFIVLAFGSIFLPIDMFCFQFVCAKFFMMRLT